MRACAAALIAVLALSANAQQPRRGGVTGGVMDNPGPLPESRRERPIIITISLDERIRRRTDPHLIEARLKAASGTGSARTTDVIDGTFNPELFLPHELFDNVITGAFRHKHWRDFYTPDAVEAGLPPDVWDRLEPIARTYIQLLREHRWAPRDRSVSGRLRASLVASSMELTLCRERAQALHAARGAFGPAFDRFLYEHVAPPLKMWTDDPIDARLLRDREEGCR